jgi:hypothetical protein
MLDITQYSIDHPAKASNCMAALRNRRSFMQVHIQSPLSENSLAPSPSRLALSS